MDKAELDAMLKRVESKLRVTKVVATRSIKGRGGDTFAGFSAAWDSIQEDGGGAGASLTEMVADAEVAPQGMTLREAEVAHLMVARQAEISAWTAAFAAGNIKAELFQDQVSAVRSNYAKLIHAAIRSEE